MTYRTLLPVVLVVLLCHGVLGGLHEISGVWTVAISDGMAGHGGHAMHGGGSSGELAGEHCSAVTGYAAVLSDALAGVALALLALRRRAGRVEALYPPSGYRAAYRNLAAPVRCPARPISLQVFRL